MAIVTQVAIAQIKIVHGPYLQSVKENEATIVWLTDKPSIGWVKNGTSILIQPMA